jgi:S-adenosyl-L-methionine hydrolase (adenosine-forming)
VVFVDHFGNLITNIPGDGLPRAVRVTVADRPVSRWVRTYADAAPGTLVGLVSSGGTVEVAVAQGNAARALGVGAGARVIVTVGEPLLAES